MSTIAPRFSLATDGSPGPYRMSWSSPVARRDPSYRLPLRRVADREQKPGSATTEPLRCLGLRETRSDRFRPEPEVWPQSTLLLSVADGVRRHDSCSGSRLAG
jgi:hypothetical protein